MANSCFDSGCNGPGPKTEQHNCVCSLAQNTQSYGKGILPQNAL